jgi:hypothetical protein
LTKNGWGTFWGEFFNNSSGHTQGCQMVCFQTKNPNLGKFLGALEWKMLVYFMVIYVEYFTVFWYILWRFGNVMVIWYIFPRFGILCQEKSGIPGHTSWQPWRRAENTIYI